MHLLSSSSHSSRLGAKQQPRAHGQVGPRGLYQLAFTHMNTLSKPELHSFDDAEDPGEACRIAAAARGAGCQACYPGCGSGHPPGPNTRCCRPEAVNDHGLAPGARGGLGLGRCGGVCEVRNTPCAVSTSPGSGARGAHVGVHPPLPVMRVPFNGRCFGVPSCRQRCSCRWRWGPGRFNSKMPCGPGMLLTHAKDLLQAKTEPLCMLAHQPMPCAPRPPQVQQLWQAVGPQAMTKDLVYAFLLQLQVGRGLRDPCPWTNPLDQQERTKAHGVSCMDGDAALT